MFELAGAKWCHDLSPGNLTDHSDSKEPAGDRFISKRVRDCHGRSHSKLKVEVEPVVAGVVGIFLLKLFQSAGGQATVVLEEAQSTFNDVQRLEHQVGYRSLL